MENNFQIYKITNLLNSKSYIGQTVKGVEQRWKKHVYDAQRESSLFVHRAIKKYGSDNFKVEIIAHATKRDLLNDLEIALIVQHNTFAPDGYNLTTGGLGGTEISEITRKKMSDSHKGNTSRRGKKLSAEHKRKISEQHKGNTYCLGKKHTKETKLKMSLVKQGKKFSDETKRKMSESGLGRKHSQETKLKLSLAHKGKRLSEEHKKKISESLMGNTYNLGRKLSEEHKQKISDSGKKGVEHPRSRGIVHTPLGIFTTTSEAAKSHGCVQTAVSKRCNKNTPQWSGWYYEKSGV